MNYMPARLPLMAVLLLLSAGCATSPPPTPVTVIAPRPEVPPPAAALMRPRSPDFLQRLERILSGSQSKQTPPSSN